jgi:hypothetical protein
MHPYKDPIKLQEANKKRKETNLKKYGRITPTPGKVISSSLKKSYKRKKEELATLPILSKATIIKLLNSKKYHYTKYFGKSKNRTMIKECPQLYTSLMHHTEPYRKYNRCSQFFNLTFKLLLAGKYKFIIQEKFWCRCKKYIMFDPIIQKFREWSYCKSSGCALGPNSKDHFKYLYKENWEEKYKQLRIDPENTLERKERRSKGSRIGYQKRKNRTDTNFHAIGKNETKILDSIEKQHNCIIDRNFSVIGYYPDGYCHETNTIYEVYEKYHSYEYMKIKDKKRQERIMAHLNCNFEIIWDI